MNSGFFLTPSKNKTKKNLVFITILTILPKFSHWKNLIWDSRTSRASCGTLAHVSSNFIYSSISRCLVCFLATPLVAKLLCHEARGWRLWFSYSDEFLIRIRDLALGIWIGYWGVWNLPTPNSTSLTTWPVILMAFTSCSHSSFQAKMPANSCFEPVL